MAICQLQLRILVPGVDLDAGLEVLDSLLGLEDGGIGGGTAVVCLDEARVQLDCLGRIRNRISVGLCLELRLYGG